MSHPASGSKAAFLANLSPQLIDLSLEKGWYVSLQIPPPNDLKLDAELYEVLSGELCLTYRGRVTLESTTLVFAKRAHGPPLPAAATSTVASCATQH